MDPLKITYIVDGETIQVPRGTNIPFSTMLKWMPLETRSSCTIWCQVSGKSFQVTPDSWDELQRDLKHIRTPHVVLSVMKM